MAKTVHLTFTSMRYLPLKKGFTLAETLISVAIFVAISSLLASFVRSIFSTNANLSNSLSAQFDSRQSLKKITRELREASPSSLGAYPISAAATNTITFYTNIDSDTLKERIRYFIQNGDLKRATLKPSGTPLSYNPANEVTETLVKNISNSTSTPLFDYFDENYSGTSSPLTIPVNIPSIRLVRITLTIEKDPYRLPAPFTTVTQVMIRNLKGNL